MSSTGRQRSLIFPREHGAWGILLVPLVTGAAAGQLTGHGTAQLAPLTAAVLTLFWLRTPVESWIGTSPIKARTQAEFRAVHKACALLGSVAAASLIWLFWGWRNGGLLWVGAAATLAFIGQAAIRNLWRQARTAAQMIGAAGLTAVAPAAYYVATGGLNRTAWSLWLLNLLFAVNQIEFVQLRIRAARAQTRTEKWVLGRNFVAAQLLAIVLPLAGCTSGLINWYVSLAFLPILWRGFAWFLTPFQPLLVHALGKRELAHAIVFGALLIGSFALA